MPLLDDLFKPTWLKKLTPLVALFADTHIGSNTAIAPAVFRNDDNQLIHASPLQIWLLDNWNTVWAEVWERAKNRPVIAVVNGDLIDGNHHESTQLMPNIADQEQAAFEILEPIRHKANRFYVVRGTSAHGGEASHNEKTLSTRLGADSCSWELLIDINNELYNIAHHVGARVQTAVEECIRSSIKLGERIPNWVFRAHKHVVDDTGTKYSFCRGVTLPAWQLRTGFGFKVSSHRVSDIGLAMVDNKELIMRTFTTKRHIIHEDIYND